MLTGHHQRGLATEADEETQVTNSPAKPLSSGPSAGLIRIIIPNAGNENSVDPMPPIAAELRQ